MTAYVGLDVRLRTDHEVAIALDLATEVAEYLPGPVQGKLAGKRVLLRQHRDLWLQAQGVRIPVGAGRRRSHCLHLRHTNLPGGPPFPFPSPKPAVRRGFAVNLSFWAAPSYRSIAGAGIFARGLGALRGI